MHTVSTISKEFEDFKVLYEEKFEHALPLISLDNVVLKDALKNQLELQIEWELVCKKISMIYDVCEHLAETAYAEAITKELKDAYKSTSISEAREFAKADKAYRGAKKLMIEVKEYRDEVKGILDTIHSRKYILNSMTSALVASVDSVIL